MAWASQSHRRVSPNDRDLSQGATIIPLAHPGNGHAGQVPAGPPRLLDCVRAALRTRHYSPRTEKAYVCLSGSKRVFT